MVKISVVILNWNGYRDTVECVESVKKCNPSPEIIVVDNASTNESIEILSRLKGITLLRNSHNLGYAGGNNVGIEHALRNGAEYICILNNDTLVSKNLFKDFLDSMKTHPNGGAFCPKIYFAKGYEFHKDRYTKADLGKVIWYAGGKLDWANIYGSNVGVDEVDNGQFNVDTVTDFATGACFFISREVLEKVGAFDDKYFLYLEDVDLSQRISLLGYKVWYLAKPHLWHKVSQSSAIGGELNDYFITRNRLLFGMRYASLRTKYALARESFRFMLWGRKWQRKGARDYYLGKLGKGSWKK